MTNYDELRSKLLSDPAVKEEYESLRPEYDIISAMIEARKRNNLTQKELSERTGISQADISRLENGTRNPSLNLLKRIAAGMDSYVKIEFVPRNA